MTEPAKTTKPATQHRVGFFLTSDLAIAFSVFDHHACAVPDTAWTTFAEGQQHAHGSFPAATLTDYVVNYATWCWDQTYSDGTVVIGDPYGPFALEPDPSGPEGCRIMFWEDGTPYDTGLRVWDAETVIIAGLLRIKKELESGETTPDVVRECARREHQ
jgi:hypothetical protein